MRLETLAAPDLLLLQVRTNVDDRIALEGMVVPISVDQASLEPAFPQIASPLMAPHASDK